MNPPLSNRESLRTANLRKAVATLEQFLMEPVVSERDRAGVIQAFEYCFELLWKALQAAAESEGLRVASPKRALAAGYQLGILDDEDEWLGLLGDRNMTVHAYNADIAAAIFERIRDRHAAALRKAVSALERR